MLYVKSGLLYLTSNPCEEAPSGLQSGAVGTGSARNTGEMDWLKVAVHNRESLTMCCLQVSVADGKVKITADKASLTNVKRQKAMCRAASGNKGVLIVGGGPASVACAETLRQEGFQVWTQK